MGKALKIAKRLLAVSSIRAARESYSSVGNIYQERDTSIAHQI